MNILAKMNKYNKAFKPFDIRAIYNEDIDDNFAKNMWYAFGMRCNKQSKTKLLIANDTRPANKWLISSFIDGLKHATAADITYADLPAQDPNSISLPYGACSTSLAYYLVQQWFDYAVIFTASHNPKEYVGLKIVDNSADFVPSDTLRAMYETYLYQDAETYPITIHTAADIKDIIKDNETRYMQAASQIQKKYTAVIDFSNGSGCTREYDLIQKIKHQGIWDVICINTAADGNFPGHESDTSNPECYKQLIHEVHQHQADIGIMFDGDLDRIGVVDNTGTIVPWDMIGCLLVKKYVSTHKNETVYMDVLCSGDLYDTVIKYGGKPVITKTGRALMTPALKADQALLGIEFSGHIMYKSSGYVEQPLMVAIDILQVLDQDGQSLNAVCLDFQQWYLKPLLSIKVGNPDQCIAIIESFYQNYNIQHIDGLNIYSDDLRLTVRKSNTEPKIRIALETRDQSSRQTHMDRILQSIQI